MLVRWLFLFVVVLCCVWVAHEAQFAQWTKTLRTDDRPLAVLHVGPAKCASSFLQYWMGKQLRTDLENDGFVLPSETDFSTWRKGFSINVSAWSLQPGLEDPKLWNNATKFFNRAHSAHKPLILSAEGFARRNMSVHMLKTFLAPWNTHVVLIYRPFYDWVVSLHNQRFYRWPNFPPLTEWLTFDNIDAFASDTADVSFSMGLRGRYLAHGFRVTVLALNSSLLFDFVCNVVGATRACQHLQEIPNVMDQRRNARKSSPCMAKVCLLSDKLQLLLNLSVQIDGEMPVEVQRSEPLLREDFAGKVGSKYFCSCDEPPVGNEK